MRGRNYSLYASQRSYYDSERLFGDAEVVIPELFPFLAHKGLAYRFQRGYLKPFTTYKSERRRTIE
jgi:hypothetical protein